MQQGIQFTDLRIYESTDFRQFADFQRTIR